MEEGGGGGRGGIDKEEGGRGRGRSSPAVLLSSANVADLQGSVLSRLLCAPDGYSEQMGVVKRRMGVAKAKVWRGKRHRTR